MSSTRELSRRSNGLCYHYSPPTTDDTGDYTAHTTFPVPTGSPIRPLCTIELHTLFSSRRLGPYEPPFVDLTHRRGTVPAQPQPVSLGPPSVVGSVLGYIGSFTAANVGDQIDTLRTFSSTCTICVWDMLTQRILDQWRDLTGPSPKSSPSRLRIGAQVARILHLWHQAIRRPQRAHKYRVASGTSTTASALPFRSEGESLVCLSSLSFD